MGAQERGRWYRHVDAALLRASAHTGDVVPECWPDPDDDTKIEQWCARLGDVWAQAPVAEAVAVASPALADRVEAVCAGLRPEAGQVRLMVMSVARYLVRMRGRATPFGAFDGVAPLRFGAQVSVRWTDGHRTRIRADAVWLAGVIARPESYPGLRQRLPVMVNDVVVVRGERLVVPWQPHATDPGRDTPVEVSVRHSELVRIIMQAARSPVPVGDLLDKLGVEIPDVPVAAIDAMVAELVARGVLITSLRPPSTSTDGLAYVLHRLQEVDAAAVAAAPVIQAQLQAADRTASWVDGRTGRATATRMRALSTASAQPLIVNLRLGCTMVLPSQVATEAEWAASAVAAAVPGPAGESRMA